MWEFCSLLLWCLCHLIVLFALSLPMPTWAIYPKFQMSVCFSPCFWCLPTHPYFLPFCLQLVRIYSHHRKKAHVHLGKIHPSVPRSPEVVQMWNVEWRKEITIAYRSHDTLRNKDSGVCLHEWLHSVSRAEARRPILRYSNYQPTDNGVTEIKTVSGNGQKWMDPRHILKLSHQEKSKTIVRVLTQATERASSWPQRQGRHFVENVGVVLGWEGFRWGVE